MENNLFFKVSNEGLDTQSVPMLLFQKAKKYGIWNPQDLNFEQDKKDWQGLTLPEKSILKSLTALFIGGEESVTIHLLPLILAVAKEGRIEEEIFLTSFLWEEAKHVEGFDRFLKEVLGNEGANLSELHTPSYKAIFYNELPTALNALLHSPTPYNLAEASVTYNMIVEGMLAETGYYAYYKVLKNNNLMPGLVQLIAKLKQDESRHIAFGVHLLSRLVAEHGSDMWQVIENRMNYLFEPALNIIPEILQQYEVLPFEIDMEDIMNFAMSQFQKRFARIEKSIGKNVTDLSLYTDDEN